MVSYPVERCTDAIILCTPDGTIIYVSPSIERITGYAPEEHIGKPIYFLIRRKDWERVAWNDLLTHQSNEISLAVRVRHKDGQWRWIEGTITNLLDDPTIQAIMGIYHDVTEQHLLAQQLQLTEKNIGRSWTPTLLV